MLVQQLADRLGPADVRFDGAGIGRRWIGGIAQDVPQDPGAANHRRRGRAIGRHLEHAGVRQHTPALTGRRQFDDTQRRPLDTGYSVVLRQPLVQDRKIRIDKVCQAQVPFEHLLEEQLCLLDDGLAQQHVAGIACQLG